jgi:hypothetical protein
MDNKPRSQEAFTLPRQWVAEMILSSVDFGRSHRRGDMDEMTERDLVEFYLGMLDSFCEHNGTTDLAAVQKAKGPCYVTLVGPR